MVDELCRVCLDTKYLLNIFKTDYNIGNKIMQISNVTISAVDELPSYLCINCKQKIDNFYEFKCLIERSDSFLRSILFQGNVKLDAKSNTIENNQQQINTDIKLSDSSNFLHQHSEENYSSENDNTSEHNAIVIEITKNPIKYTNIPKFQCYLCGVLLSSNHCLKKHIRIHTGEKPFECVVCRKSFTSAFNLKIHTRTHTGEKPLQCSLCPMKFAQPASLVAHQRNHTGELPYKCNLCPRTFKSNSSLKYHIVTHTGEKNYFCSICKRGFITKGDVKNHEKTHSDEKPFICPICGLRLRRAYSLKRHIKTHSGTKNHKCDLCNVAFSQKYDLKRHTNSHLKKKLIKS